MKLNYSKHFLTAATALLAVVASSCKDDITDVLSENAYIEPDASAVKIGTFVAFLEKILLTYNL